MTSFHIFAEQVQAAPPEVRRWMESEIVKALSLQAHSLSEPSQLQASTPAICTIDELVQLLSLISGNSLVIWALFELARETSITPNSLGLHVLRRNEMQRHVQLGDGHQPDRMSQCDQPRLLHCSSCFPRLSISFAPPACALDRV